jgi:hypothetical protein
VKTYYEKKNARLQQQANNTSPVQPDVQRPLIATVGAQSP